MQRLVTGPVSPLHRSSIQQHLQGVSPEYIHNILHEPWMTVPRVDAAVHLRNQFTHFEKFQQLNKTASSEEAKQWLASAKGTLIFKEIAAMLSNKLINITLPTVYVAGDNAIVKAALRDFLARDSFKLQVMWQESEEIHHIGSGEHQHSIEVMRLLAIDWYIMSRASFMIAWREGQVISTFAQSAHRMNTFDVSDCSTCEKWPQLFVKLRDNPWSIGWEYTK